MSCGLRDVMEFESLGVPSVLVSTTAFVDAADQQTVLLGQPALARVHIPHPIQNRTDGEVHMLARDAVGAVLAAIA